MDNECSLEGIKATLNVEKQAYMAVPLNRYKTLPEQTEDYLKNEFDIHVNELKTLLEVGIDLEHASEKVVFDVGGATWVEKKKRGRKIRNVRTKPISTSFDLPHYCYDTSMEIEKILATPPMDYDPEKHRDIITPFELRKFTIAERARNWTMEMSRRDDNRVHDVYSTHLPSKEIFRSKLGVIRFILHEYRPKNTSKKRKSSEPANEDEVH